jgi:hypothetical protein
VTSPVVAEEVVPGVRVAVVDAVPKQAVERHAEDALARVIPRRLRGRVHEGLKAHAVHHARGQHPARGAAGHDGRHGAALLRGEQPFEQLLMARLEHVVALFERALAQLFGQRAPVHGAAHE